MAIDAGSINVKIKGDMTDLQSALNSLNSKLDTTQKKSGGLLAGLGGLKGIAIAGIGAAAAGLGALSVGAIKAASNMENLNAEFKVMLGSAEQAKILTDQIKKLGAATPFAAEDLARSTKTLLQFGIAQKDVISTLKTLGDIAGNSKERLASLSLVFGQISSAGKLQGQDLLQLINLGFNPLQIMAEKSGKSMSVLRDEMSKGLITFDMVKEAFQSATSEGGLFFKNMETQSKTLTGRLSTLGDEFNQSLAAVGNVFLPILKDSVIELTGFTVKIREFVESAKGISIIQNIAGFFNVLKESILIVGGIFKDLFTTIFKDVFDGFKQLNINLSDTGFILNLIGGYLSFVSGYFAVLGKVIGLVIKTVFNLTDVFKAFGKFLFDYWKNIAIIIGTGVKSFINIFQSLFDAIKKIGENIPKILKALTEKDFKKVLSLTTETIQAIGNVGDTVANSIKDTSGAVLEAAVENVDNAGKVVDKVKKYYKDGFTGIKAIVDEVFAQIGDTAKVEEIQKRLQTAFSKAFQVEGTDPTQPSQTETNGKDPIKKATDFLTVAKIVTEAGDAISKNLDGLAGTFSSVGSTILSGIGNAISTFSTAGATLGEKVKAVASTIGEGLSSGIQLASEILSANFDNEINNLRTKHDTELAMIEERLAKEIELIENNGLTKEELRNQELASLQNQLLIETDSTKQAALQKQIAELEKEKKIADAKKKADREKAMSEFQLAKAEYELSKKQFEINKALQGVQAGIAYALGLVNLWSSVWTVGNPIAAAAIGGVMTGVLTGIFATQLGFILAQQFPSQAPTPPAFATGTVNFRGGAAIVGEQGPELAEFPQGTSFTPAGATSDILNRPINLVVNIGQEKIAQILVDLSKQEALYV